MELNINNVIKGIILTPKSSDLFSKLGKITFKVDPVANKLVIRKAVETIWNVKVANVRVIKLPGKTRKYAGHQFTSSGKKKAIVTLRKGYKIDLPGHLEGIPGSFGESKVLNQE